jgi:hypothetical protein
MEPVKPQVKQANTTARTKKLKAISSPRNEISD